MRTFHAKKGSCSRTIGPLAMKQAPSVSTVMLSQQLYTIVNYCRELVIEISFPVYSAPDILFSISKNARSLQRIRPCLFYGLPPVFSGTAWKPLKVAPPLTP